MGWGQKAQGALSDVLFMLVGRMLRDRALRRAWWGLVGAWWGQVPRGERGAGGCNEGTRQCVQGYVKDTKGVLGGIRRVR